MPVHDAELVFNDVTNVKTSAVKNEKEEKRH